MFESFIKQRRNLLLFSTLVLFLNVANAEITKLNILGNNVDIKNPHVVSASLFIALMYFSIRYLQYMHGIESKGFESAFDKSLRKSISKILIRRIEKMHLETKFTETYQKLKMEHLSISGGFNSCEAYISVSPIKGGTHLDYSNQILKRSELVFPYFRAFMYIFLNTHLVSEYVLPVAYAAVSFLSFNKTFALCLASML